MKQKCFQIALVLWLVESCLLLALMSSSKKGLELATALNSRSSKKKKKSNKFGSLSSIFKSLTTIHKIKANS